MTGRSPLRELLGRYGAVFQSAWQQRHALAGPQRLADEAAFLPAALSLQDTPVHPAPRRLAFALIALFALALVWSIVGQVDIVAVAPGRIVVSARTKVIQPLEASVVQRVLVKDGDLVEAGQALIELDPTRANADKINVDDQLKSAQSEVLRTRALTRALVRTNASAGRSPELPSTSIPKDWTTEDTRAAQAQLAAEWSDITAKLAKFASELARRQAEIATVREMVAKLETTVPIARQREADFKQLADQGFMSSHANQDRTRERIELERDLSTQRARMAEANATLRESENTSGNSDILSISDIASDQLWFAKSGNNLIVSAIGTTDSMTVQNWYSGNAYHVEKFQTSDGKTLLDTQVQNLVQAMAGFAPPSAGQTTLPANYQNSLNTVIAANWH